MGAAFIGGRVGLGAMQKVGRQAVAITEIANADGFTSIGSFTSIDCPISNGSSTSMASSISLRGSSKNVVAFAHSECQPMPQTVIQQGAAWIPVVDFGGYLCSLAGFLFL
ncbi:unnamed protein product [Rhizopus stolonifer]